MKNAIYNALKNWRTTSAGVAMIVTSVIHLVFAVRHGTADETTWTTSILTTVAGLGLIFAGDAAASRANHEESKQAISTLTEAMVKNTGDTTILTKMPPAIAETAVTTPLPITSTGTTLPTKPKENP